MLKIKKLRLPGPFLIELKIFRDKRGFLYETWNEELYFKSKIKSKIVQVVYSHSKKNTLRGIHFQYPNLQGKLVSVINGKIFDVIVDIRKKKSKRKLKTQTKRRCFITPPLKMHIKKK